MTRPITSFFKKTTLEAAIESRQPLNAVLTNISSLTPTSGQLLIGGSSGWTTRGLVFSDLPNLSGTYSLLTDARFPTSGQKAALAGSNGAPDDSNRYVTSSDPRLENTRPPGGPAGGALTGTYPNPTLSSPDLNAITSLNPFTGHFIVRGSNSWTSRPLNANDVPDLSQQYASGGRTLTGIESITGGGDLTGNRTFSLVNDLNSPGASRYYGTNLSGTKGWFAFPGAAVQSVNSFTGAVNLTTADVPEVTNLYFTTARVRTSISVNAPISYNSSTGVLSIPQANTSNSGFLTSADWNSFNNKTNLGHSHASSDVTDLQSLLDAKANTAHLHSISQVTGLQVSLDGKQTASTELNGIASISANGFVRRTGTGTYSSSAIASSDLPDLSSIYVVASRTVATSGSLTGGGVLSTNRTLSLVNDLGNPGNSFYYGTDSSGTKGWYNLPEPESGAAVNSVNGLTGTVTLNTDQVLEGSSNRYFTNTRARNILSANSPLTYDAASGVFTIQQAGTSQPGFLNAADWNTFNNKANSGHNHPISDISGLQSALNGKADSLHTHSIGQVTGLQATLDGKQASSLELTGVASLNSLGFVRRTGIATYSSSALIASDIPDLSSQYPPVSRTISTSGSLTGGGALSANRTLSLVNDAATPGNSFYYGTDSSGAKGWYSLPTGSGGSSISISGVTGLQLTLDNKQNLSAELTALSTLDTEGFVRRNASGSYSASAFVSEDLPSHSHAIADVTGLQLYRPLITAASNKTLGSEDANMMLRCTAAVTLTVPTDSTNNFPIGTEIEVLRDSSGNVTISQQSPVISIRRSDNAAVTGHTIASQYAAVLLKKVAANEWRIFGGLS